MYEVGRLKDQAVETDERVSSLLLLFWEYGTWSVCGAVVKIGVEVAIEVGVVCTVEAGRSRSG